MNCGVSAIAVTVGTSGKGGELGCAVGGRNRFLPRSCRDPSAPCRKRRATLIVMKNQEGIGLQTGHHKG
jgi:hypothetical protein